MALSALATTLLAASLGQVELRVAALLQILDPVIPANPQHEVAIQGTFVGAGHHVGDRYHAHLHRVDDPRDDRVQVTMPDTFLASRGW